MPHENSRLFFSITKGPTINSTFSIHFRRRMVHLIISSIFFPSLLTSVDFYTILQRPFWNYFCTHSCLLKLPSHLLPDILHFQRQRTGHTWVLIRKYHNYKGQSSFPAPQLKSFACFPCLYCLSPIFFCFISISFSGFCLPRHFLVATISAIFLLKVPFNFPRFYSGKKFPFSIALSIFLRLEWFL